MHAMHPHANHPLSELPPLVGPYKSLRAVWIGFFERAYFRALLERHDRRIADAAREAGVDRTYLHRMIRRHGL